MTVSVRLAGAGLHEKEGGVVRLERRSSEEPHFAHYPSHPSLVCFLSNTPLALTHANSKLFQTLSSLENWSCCVRTS